jgi:hypothetical protein
VGGGNWNATTYRSTTQQKIQTGTTYAYTQQQQRTSRHLQKAHDDLNPLTAAGAASPLAGQIVRESRDNDDHPTSTPLAVFFDDTGSMGLVPRVVQTKLADLFGLLLRKGYLEHPQVMVGSYGDQYSDSVPLQLSQFESDNRIDDALDKIFLEGNGGGNGGESQWLAWYYLAYHTATDAWEKRQKKGYAFFVGDEISHEGTAEAVKKYVGDGEPLGSLKHEDLVKALLEKWDAYVFVIDNMSAKSQRSIPFYQELFGKDRVLVVENEEAIAETIALAVGIAEGTIDLDDGVDDLKALGVSDDTIRQATKALAVHKGAAGGGAVVPGDTPADLTEDDDAVARI